MRDVSNFDRRQTIEETPSALDRFVPVTERNFEVDELRVSPAKVGDADFDHDGRHHCHVVCIVSNRFNGLSTVVEVRV